jgi:hypothetical protein
MGSARPLSRATHSQTSASAPVPSRRFNGDRVEGMDGRVSLPRTSVSAQMKCHLRRLGRNETWKSGSLQLKQHAKKLKMKFWRGEMQEGKGSSGGVPPRISGTQITHFPPSAGPGESGKIDRLTNFLTTHTFPGPISRLQLTLRSGHPETRKKEKSNFISQWPANQVRRWPTRPLTPFWCSTLGEHMALMPIEKSTQLTRSH